MDLCEMQGLIPDMKQKDALRSNAGVPVPDTFYEAGF